MKDHFRINWLIKMSLLEEDKYFTFLPLITSKQKKGKEELSPPASCVRDLSCAGFCSTVD